MNKIYVLMLMLLCMSLNPNLQCDTNDPLRAERQKVLFRKRELRDEIKLLEEELETMLGDKTVSPRSKDPLTMHLAQLPQTQRKKIEDIVMKLSPKYNELHSLCYIPLTTQEDHTVYLTVACALTATLASGMATHYVLSSYVIKSDTISKQVGKFLVSSVVGLTITERGLRALAPKWIFAETQELRVKEKLLASLISECKK